MFGVSLPRLDYPIYIIKFFLDQPDEKYVPSYTSYRWMMPPPVTKTTSTNNDGQYDLTGLAYAVTKAPPKKSSGREGYKNKNKNKIKKTTPPPPPRPFIDALKNSMIYQIEFGNITTLSKLNSLYSHLSTKIMSYMGDGSDARNNLAALIYFMVVIENKFKEFMSRLPYYNYLQATYPNVFTNDIVYRKFVVIKYYFESLIPLFNTFDVSYKVRYRKLFGRTHYRTRYKTASIGIEDSVMKYMVPVILKEIKLVLDDNNDIPDTNDLPETAFFSGE